MLSIILLIVVVAAVMYRLQTTGESPSAARAAGRAACREVAVAFKRRESLDWLTMSGRVSRLLSDEQGMSTHQRFVVHCQTESQTVLIVNNVTVGRRVPVSLGSYVVVRGQYIWNRQGGLIHDTHHATDSNPNGWIYLRNHIYQ